MIDSNEAKVQQIYRKPTYDFSFCPELLVGLYINNNVSGMTQQGKRCDVRTYSGDGLTLTEMFY